MSHCEAMNTMFSAVKTTFGIVGQDFAHLCERLYFSPFSGRERANKAHNNLNGVFICIFSVSIKYGLSLFLVGSKVAYASKRVNRFCKMPQSGHLYPGLMTC